MLKKLIFTIFVCLGLAFAQDLSLLKINLDMPVDYSDSVQPNYVPESITKAIDNMKFQPKQKHIILRHNYFDIVERYLENDSLDHYWFWNYKLIINF